MPISKFREVEDGVGNVTLQPLGADEQRAAAFRKTIEDCIELGKNLPDPTRVWFDIGPVEAQVLLDFSKGNRKEAESTIAMYGRDILNDWRQTHQGMAFARSGRMGDGHHRCYAVVQSGGTIRVAIDFGVDDNAFEAVDMARGRNVRDQLAVVHGVKSSTKFVAAIRMCMTLAQGKLHIRKWSVAEVRAGLERHKTAIESLWTSASVRHPASFWGAMLFAHPKAPALVEELAKRVIDGRHIDGTAYTLREYLTHITGRTPPFDVAVRTLYAARAFIEGRPLSRFAPRDERIIMQWFTEGRAA